MSLVVCVCIGHGQDSSKISVIPADHFPQQSSLSFERLFNTYVWNGIFQKEIRIGLWNMNIFQSVQSRYIVTQSPAIQDEYQGLVSISRKLAQQWSWEILDTSNVLADNKVIELDRMAKHQMLTGLQFADHHNIYADVQCGYEINTQEDQKDAGFTYGAQFEDQSMPLEEFATSFNASWKHSLLGKRNPHDGGVQVSFLRLFSESVADSLTLGYTNQKREFYTGLPSVSQMRLGISNNIYWRVADAFNVANYLRSAIGENIFLHASLGVSNQTIQRGYLYKDYTDTISLELDSRIQELEIFGTAELNWRIAPWWRMNTQFLYSERDENHTINNDPLAPTQSIYTRQQENVNRLDNTIQQTALSFGTIVNTTQNDSISWTSRVGILRYDTPDKLNTDDRDEFLFASGLQYAHIFSRYLQSVLDIDFNCSHLVYLHSTRSANNNWNYILRLSPSIEYAPSQRFHTIVRSEVLANYTVYDYNQQINFIKDYAYRQVAWYDSTSFKLSSRVELTFLGSLRLFERGVLKWQDFAEQPQEYYVESSLWPELMWRSTIGVIFGCGVKYFLQDRYLYMNTQRLLDQRIESIGPTARIEWWGTGFKRVSIVGSHENQKNNGKTTAVITNLSMRLELLL